MADPATYRPRTSDIPDQPGVYRFRDGDGRVIYVGKALSLRSRLTSYFQDPAQLHPRTFAMVNTACSVDWVVVQTEVEALQLEWQWIQEFEPRFNVRFRDDKSYPWLAITMNETYPRAMVMRGERRKGVKYFGPYVHAWAIREALDQLTKVFPVRTCSNSVFRRAELQQRPCLLGYIDKCSAPCVGRIEPADHRRIAGELAAFLDGNTAGVMRRLTAEMQQAAIDERYELAARLRDQLQALRLVLEQSAVVLAEDVDADVIAIADDELQASVQVFHVRQGRVRGQRSLLLERPLELSPGDLVEQVCERLYGGESGEYVPRLILVEALPEDVEQLTAWLGGKRGTAVELRVPQRGDKRTLLDTVAKNALLALQRSKLQRSNDITSRSRALQELQEALGLPSAPLRIECTDVSHLQGDDVVASLVVFEDGLPKKSDYRRFIIRHGLGNNDVASIAEVVTRRFRSRDDEEESERRFAYAPGLFVVDGGAPQVRAAATALAALGVEDVPIIGLAKRLEEIWLPDEEDPVILARTSEALYLLQRIRDEAHRFALAHQKQRRSKGALASILDDVPGLGDAKRKALLKAFSSLKRMRAAGRDELLAVPGIGPTIADALIAALAVAPKGLPAFSATTGEVLDESEQ